MLAPPSAAWPVCSSWRDIGVLRARVLVYSDSMPTVVVYLKWPFPGECCICIGFDLNMLHSFQVLIFNEWRDIGVLVYSDSMPTVVVYLKWPFPGERCI